MEAKEYRISEIAEILGVSADTLRLYEKRGLLTPRKRENGYRYYTKEDVKSFLWILYSRKLNFGLEEILELKEDEPEVAVQSLKEHIILAIEREVEILSEHRRILKRLTISLQDIASIEENMGRLSVRNFPKARILKICPDYNCALEEWYSMASAYPGLDMSYLYECISLEKGDAGMAGKTALLLYREAEKAVEKPEQWDELPETEPVPCVYTVVQKEEETVGAEDFMEMKKWARNQGYETEQEGWSTSAVCRDGIRRPFHYIELYLPLKR